MLAEKKRFLNYLYQIWGSRHDNCKCLVTPDHDLTNIHFSLHTPLLPWLKTPSALVITFYQAFPVPAFDLDGHLPGWLNERQDRVLASGPNTSTQPPTIEIAMLLTGRVCAHDINTMFTLLHILGILETPRPRPIDFYKVKPELQFRHTIQKWRRPTQSAESGNCCS